MSRLPIYCLPELKLINMSSGGSQAEDTRERPWKATWPPRPEDIIHAESRPKSGTSKAAMLILSAQGMTGKDETKLYILDESDPADSHHSGPGGKTK